MKRLAAVFALILFLTTSVTGGFLVVLCPKPKCDSRSAATCHSAVRAECRPSCPTKAACPIEERRHRPAPEPDQTRVVLILLLAVDSCDVQRCSKFCAGTGLNDYREVQIPARPDPGLTLCITPVNSTAESPPPADTNASRPPGVHPHLQTVVLRC